MKRPAMQWSCDMCGKDGGVGAERPAGWIVGPAELPDICEECSAKPSSTLCEEVERVRKAKKKKGKDGDKDDPPH